MEFITDAVKQTEDNYSQSRSRGTGWTNCPQHSGGKNPIGNKVENLILKTYCLRQRNIRLMGQIKDNSHNKQHGDKTHYY